MAISTVNLHTGQLDILQHGDPLGTFFGGDAPGAPVGNQAIGVNRAEIAAHRHIAGADLQANAGRFQYTAPNLVYQRVVTEQRQVSRTAARRNPARDRDAQPGAAFARQSVQIGRLGGFEFGLSILLARQPTETVHHQQQNLAALSRASSAHQVKVRHRFCLSPRDARVLSPFNA